MPKRPNLKNALDDRLATMPKVEKGKGADQFFEATDTVDHMQQLAQRIGVEAEPPKKKKRGRRRLSDVKVVFYLLNEQYDWLNERAADTNQSLSALVRQLIDDARSQEE